MSKYSNIPDNYDEESYDPEPDEYPCPECHNFWKDETCELCLGYGYVTEEVLETWMREKDPDE